MKKLFITLLATAALVLPATVRAESKGKAITVSGEGACAKCALHQTDKCQNTITVEKNGKKTVYYLADNKVSKGFHGEICKESKQVTATGTCKKEGDKLVLTVSKIAAK